MNGHWKHLAMCAPMLVIAAVLVIGGTNVVAAALPVLGCVLMMAVMMRLMGHGVRVAAHRHGDVRDERGASR